MRILPIKKRALCVLALGIALTGCATTPVVQGQSGSVTDERLFESTELDHSLLRQVDMYLVTADASLQDVIAAKQLRDSAVDLANRGLYSEANGNLKMSAFSLGLLSGPGGEPVVKAQPLPAAPAAPAQPRSATTLINGFDAQTPNWEHVGPTSINGGAPVWTVNNGVVRQRGVEGVDAADDQVGLVTGDKGWTDVTIAANVLANGNPEFGLILRHQNGNFYRFRALAFGNGTNSGNYFIEKVVDGTTTIIAQLDGQEMGLRDWHTISFSAQGTTLTASVDGKTLGSVTDTSLAAGNVGISTIATDGAYFAHLQVSRS